MRQGTKEWLEYRRTKIGASDAPIIMGVSPYRTAYQLWEDKVFGSTQEVSPAMQRGKDLEEPARVLFEQMTGLIMLPAVRESSERPWQIASLDGMTIEENAIVEIKCGSRDEHSDVLKGFVPYKYFPQLQHQLCVTNLDMAYYFSFNGEEGAIVKVYRDEEYIQNLIKQEELFYECMQEVRPPEMSHKDIVDINSEEWALYTERYRTVSEHLKKLEQEEKELRESLINLANNRSCRGNGLQISKIIQKGNVDYKKIPELQGVNMDLYRKEPIQKWKFTLS